MSWETDVLKEGVSGTNRFQLPRPKTVAQVKARAGALSGLGGSGQGLEKLRTRARRRALGGKGPGVRGRALDKTTEVPGGRDAEEDVERFVGDGNDVGALGEGRRDRLTAMAEGLRYEMRGPSRGIADFSKATKAELVKKAESLQAEAEAIVGRYNRLQEGVGELEEMLYRSGLEMSDIPEPRLTWREGEDTRTNLTNLAGRLRLFEDKVRAAKMVSDSKNKTAPSRT